MSEWNEDSPNAITLPAGVSIVHAVAVWPIIAMFRHVPAGSCKVCGKSRAAPKIEEKLERAGRQILTPAENSSEITLPGISFSGSRYLGVRVFFQLAEGGRWIQMTDDYDLPARRAATMALLGEEKVRMDEEHALNAHGGD